MKLKTTGRIVLSHSHTDSQHARTCIEMHAFQNLTTGSRSAQTGTWMRLQVLCTDSRSSMILPDFLRCKFGVHNGRAYLPVEVRFGAAWACTWMSRWHGEHFC